MKRLVTQIFLQELYYFYFRFVIFSVEIIIWQHTPEGYKCRKRLFCRPK